MKNYGVTLIDVIVATALIGLAAAFCLAQAALMDDVASRVKCASNLRQIGQAILLYSNDNKGAYPRVTYDAGADGNPKPVWGTPYENNKNLGAAEKIDGEEAADPFLRNDKPGARFKPQANDVTAALFLLLRTQDITPEVFVCPATLQERWDLEGGANTALHWTNWKGTQSLREHLSYSYHNLYPSTEAIRKSFRRWRDNAAELALASDMNPGTEALLKLNTRSTPKDMRAGNSPNHSRDGQNCLYADFHVQFEQHPFVGVNRDNIFTFGPSGDAAPDKGGDGIIGPTSGPDDSILLPTARAIGSANESGDLIEVMQLQPLTVEQARDIRQEITGRYERIANDRKSSLEISDDKLIISSGPLTVIYSYQVLGGLHDSGVRLTLTAPQTPAGATNLFIEGKGAVRFSTNQYLQGTWPKK